MVCTCHDSLLSYSFEMRFVFQKLCAGSEPFSVRGLFFALEAGSTELAGAVYPSAQAESLLAVRFRRSLDC